MGYVDGLEKLIEQEGLRQDFGEMGANYIRENYSLPASVANIGTIYKTIMREGFGN